MWNKCKLRLAEVVTLMQTLIFNTIEHTQHSHIKYFNKIYISYHGEVFLIQEMPLNSRTSGESSLCLQIPSKAICSKLNYPIFRNSFCKSSPLLGSKQCRPDNKNEVNIMCLYRQKLKISWPLTGTIDRPIICMKTILYQLISLPFVHPSFSRLIRIKFSQILK